MLRNVIKAKTNDVCQMFTLFNHILDEFISYNKLARKLREKDCEYIRQGKGSHEIWRGPKDKFSVPRHPGDLKRGTVMSIVRKAGFDFSLSELTAG